MTIVGYDDIYKPDLIELVANFYQEALHEYSAPIDEGVLLEAIEKHKAHIFLLIINDKCEGVIAGVETASPLNCDKVYQEFIWYVNQPHRLNGVRFLMEVQKMLKAQGYAQLIMALMHNSKAEKLQRLYERMGFAPFETHYLKKL